MRHLVSVLPDFNATITGSAVLTPSSVVVEVAVDGTVQILKCSFEQEERTGLHVQTAWEHPMAQILQLNEYPHFGMTAAVMERGDANSHPRIEDTALICALIHQLHVAPVQPAPDELRPLTSWFSSLVGDSGKTSALEAELDTARLPRWALDTLIAGAQEARELLANPHPRLAPVALHGDVHHGNILPFAPHPAKTPSTEHSTAGHLDSGPSSWKFIDPKGLFGEPLFDYCNLLYNPDLTQAAETDLFAHRAGIVGKHLTATYKTELHQRYMRWVLAYGALSAAWHLEDDAPAQALPTLRIAQLALAELRA